MVNNFIQFFLSNELFHTVVLLGGFSYAIGVIFLPLLVQDILIGAISHKWSSRIWKCQFYPIINFILFICIFILILFKLIWWCVKRIVWNVIHLADYDKYYKEIIVPKKYKLPEKFKK
jgi:predicted membrane protein